MARSEATVAVAAVSITLTLGLIALLITLVTGLSMGQQGLRGLAVTSITLQFISTALAISLGLDVWRRRSNGAGSPRLRTGTRGKHLLPSIVFSILAATITLATLIVAKIQLDELTHLILGSRPGVVLVLAFIFWIASLMLQTALHFIIHQQPKSHVDRGMSNRHYSSAMTTSDMTNANELNTVSAHSPQRGPQDPSSPPLTPRTMNGDISLRSSVTLAVRPAKKQTSKTKLLSQSRAFFRNSSATTSTVSNFDPSRYSQDSSLDAWDTSSVNPSIRETVLRSAPSTGNNAVLSPIPGSRSPSPANILEGPFNFPIPPSSAPTSMPASPVLSPQLNFSRPSNRLRSSSAESLHLAERSSSIAEEHIHPLFRTCSPIPAPFATPGTNVTAAPGSFEGLRINERNLHRMRSEKNLPSNRSFHSPSSAGPSSPLGRPSPMSYPDEDTDGGFDRVVGREEASTSPTPEFVLADSKSSRNSWSRR